MNFDSPPSGLWNRWTKATVLASALAMALSVVGLPPVANAAVDATLVRVIGGPGHAQLYPSGLEVAPNGDIVVADTGNDSVTRYAANGTLIWRVDSAGGKSLANVRDIAVGSDGSIYVADDQNSRVVKLGADGAFIAAWVGPATDKIGSPMGISFKNNRIYVADALRKKIRVFAPDGTQESAIGTAGACVMANARDADADSAGNVYVANYVENNILKFSASGQCLGKWGVKGTAAGQFKNPYGVRIANDPVWGESVYVADSNNNRIQVFSTSGQTLLAMIGTTGNPADDGAFTTLRRVAVAADGDVWGADLWGRAVERFDRTGSGYVYAQRIGGEALPFGANSVFNEPRQLAFAADGRTHVVDTVNQRVVRFTASGSPDTACGQRTSAPISINWPRGIAIDPVTGDRIVADTKQNRLQVWPDTAACTPQTRYGTVGTGTGQMNWPHSVAIRNSDRVLFVADTKNHRITSWNLTTDAKGHSVATATGAAFAGLNNPRGVSVGPAGQIVVADTNNNRVLVLTYSGGAFQLDKVVSTPALGLQRPESAVMDAEGRVWIADTQRSRVIVINSAGNMLFNTADRLFAGKKLNVPASLTVGPEGDIYVSDTGNDRVLVLHATIGPTAPTVPPIYVQTTQGPARAQMYPVDVAATATDYYVVDPGNYSLVRVRRSDGQIVATAGGHQGAGAQDFAAARALALDSAGNVYVADTPNNRISKWTAGLGFVENFGTVGTGPGQFKQVFGVTTGVGLGVGGVPQEIVYTVDGGGSSGAGGGSARIQKFTLSGDYIGEFADGFEFNQPRQIAVNPVTKDVYIVDARNRRVTVFAQNGTFRFAFGEAGAGNGQFNGDPRGIAFSQSGAEVFVTDSNNKRIQAFNSATGAFAWKIDKTTYRFEAPRGLATTPDGKLIVADEWGYGLVEFTLGSSSATVARALFGGVPSVNGVNSPRGLDINSQGQLYVVDWWNQRIVRSNLDGSADFAWGSRGPSNSPGAMNFAWDVAIQPGTDRVYVANRESNQISIFGADGAFISNQLSRGAANGQLKFPQGLAFDPTDGSLLVTDSGNARVQRFQVLADGSLVWKATYGGPTANSAVGKFKVPAGIDVAPDGTIWVADTGNTRVQKRDPNGTWTAISRPGGTTAEYQLKRPWGVTVAPDGSIWVADTGKDRIVKMSPDGTERYFAANGASMGIPPASDGTPGMDAPFSIRFGPTGQVFVSDLWNNRVLELGWP